MLDKFIAAHRDAIIDRTRAKVAARLTPRPTAAELEHGVPLFLDELSAMLRAGGDVPNSQIGPSATLRGGELLEAGFGVGQVVHDYGNICQAVTELAIELAAPITGEDFRMLNAALDEAIARAVSEFGRQREQAIADTGVEHLGYLAHEMRNLLSTAMLSFEALRTGDIGVRGSTGEMLGRSLRRMRTLIDRSLAEVRIETAGLATPERVRVAALLEEIEVAAMLEAAGRKIALTVELGAYDVCVDADPQIFAAAIANLVQNAFKFTPVGGHVAVRTHATADRVTVEIEDACGGLPPGKAAELFHPFEQRSGDRTGLGLGLTISAKAMSVLGGTIEVRDVPGKGCVFTVGLPRSAPLPA